MFIKILKKAHVMLIAVSFMACSTFNRPSQPSVIEIEKEEQVLYSFFVDAGEGPVLILQDTATNTYPGDSQDTINYLKEGLPDLSSQTLENFMERNAQVGTLSPDMNLGVEYILLTTEELSEITSQPNWGEVLSGTYSGAHGYTVFSRVGFNRSLDQAIIYVAQVSGPLMGSGYYYLMEKKNGEWRIMNEIMVWIS